MLFVFMYVYWCPTQFALLIRNKTYATSEAGNVYPPQDPMSPLLRISV